MDLDILLTKHFGDNGELEYSNLIELLYDLNRLDVLLNVNEVVDWLDEHRDECII